MCGMGTIPYHGTHETATLQPLLHHGDICGTEGAHKGPSSPVMHSPVNMMRFTIRHIAGAMNLGPDTLFRFPSSGGLVASMLSDVEEAVIANASLRGVCCCQGQKCRLRVLLNQSMPFFWTR